MNKSNVAVFLIPLVFSLCILGVCYPGFMSYDSIRMLEEARSSVRGGIFPAAPVYILRFFDITGHGATVMLQSQNFVLLLSFMIILRILRVGLFSSTISLIILIAMPTVFGCMLVLWKDVTLASFIMLSIAMIFWASQTNKKSTYFRTVKWTSLLLLMIGTLVRFNAITSTLIIAYYWLTVFYKNNDWKKRVGAIIAIAMCMSASNALINNYSIPDLRKLDPNPLMYGIMAYDLIGVSGWSRVSLIPIDSVISGLSSKVPISEIDKIYSSLGGLAMDSNNIAQGKIVNVFPEQYENKDISNQWLTAINEHPMAYISYRWDLFSEIIGAKSHETFEPTHFNRIDENHFGIKFKDRHITDIMLKYIRSASNIFIGKPWFIFLLSSISIFFIFKNRLMDPIFKKLSYYSFAAAFLYIIPFFIISGTGEVRYCFPAIVLGIISIFVFIFARDWLLLARIKTLGALSFKAI